MGGDSVEDPVANRAAGGPQTGISAVNFGSWVNVGGLASSAARGVTRRGSHEHSAQQGTYKTHTRSRTRGRRPLLGDSDRVESVRLGHSHLGLKQSTRLVMV